MKNFSQIIAAVVVTPMLAFAQPRGELKPIMKAMGSQYKILALALKMHQPTPPEALVAASDALVTLVNEAARRAPPKLIDASGKPISGMEAQLAQYDKMMAQLAVAVTDLRSALTAGDMVAAQKILVTEVDAVQRHGHEFRDKLRDEE